MRSFGRRVYLAKTASRLTLAGSMAPGFGNQVSHHQTGRGAELFLLQPGTLRVPAQAAITSDATGVPHERSKASGWTALQPKVSKASAMVCQWQSNSKLQSLCACRSCRRAKVCGMRQDLKRHGLSNLYSLNDFASHLRGYVWVHVQICEPHQDRNNARARSQRGPMTIAGSEPTETPEHPQTSQCDMPSD